MNPVTVPGTWRDMNEPRQIWLPEWRRDPDPKPVRVFRNPR